MNHVCTVWMFCEMEPSKASFGDQGGVQAQGWGRWRWGPVGGACTWWFIKKLRNELALVGERGKAVFPHTLIGPSDHFLEAAALVRKY